MKEVIIRFKTGDKDFVKQILYDSIGSPFPSAKLYVTELYPSFNDPNSWGINVALRPNSEEELKSFLREIEVVAQKEPKVSKQGVAKTNSHIAYVTGGYLFKTKDQFDKFWHLIRYEMLAMSFLQVDSLTPKVTFFSDNISYAHVNVFFLEELMTNEFKEFIKICEQLTRNLHYLDVDIDFRAKTIKLNGTVEVSFSYYKELIYLVDLDKEFGHKTLELAKDAKSLEELILYVL